MHKISDVLDISGLDRPGAIAAFYNAAQPPRRMEVYRLEAGPLVMTKIQANIFLEHNIGTSFDCIYGRNMQIQFVGKKVHCYHYDRIHGKGTAKRAIEHLRLTGAVIFTPTCSAESWLEQVVSAAMHRYDSDDKPGAYAQFLIGVARHPETKHISEQDKSRVPTWEAVITGGRQKALEAMSEWKL